MYVHVYSDLISVTILTMKRKDLIEIVRKEGINNKSLVNTLCEYAKVEDDGKEKVKTFLNNLKKRYMKHNRTWARLLEKENDWLEKDLFEEQNIKTEAGPGRPKVQFKDASDRTKRKRVAELVDQHETDALAAAAAVRGKQSPGKSDVAFVIKRTKKDAEGVRRSIEESKKMPIKMTPEDALALNCLQS